MLIGGGEFWSLMKIKLMSYRVDGDDLDSMVGGCCMGMVQEHVSLKFHPITSLSSSQKAFVGISKVAFWNRWSCGHCRRLFPPKLFQKNTASLQVRIFQSTAASIEAFYYRAMLHFLKEIPKTIPQKCQFPSASVFGRSGKVHIYIYVCIYLYIYISYISYIYHIYISYINII